VSGTRTLSEAASAALLAEYGVPVVEQALADDPDEAAAAAVDLGFPVVAKLCGDAIAHKTERGLVRLGLDDEDAVRQAAADLLGRAGPEDGEVQVLVAPFVRGSRELIAGVHRDPQFGPTVMLGLGGVLAEAVADVAFRLVPLDPVDAEDMIDQLRSQALLAPFRGEPAVDRSALVGVLLGLSAAAAARDDLVSADLNPLVIADGAPLAVDALVEVEA
jgi:acetyl-CoA synthetase (ADP-forming)